MWGWLWIISIVATMYIADQKKIRTGGYFFLSLITGPLAVIIVLLAPANNSPNTTSQGKGIEVDTLQEAKRRLQEIQFTLYAQEEKIKTLEALINRLSGSEVQAPVMNKPFSEETAPSVVEPIRPIQEERVVTVKRDMELDFGQNWLSKIGMTVFALGIAFLISYSFKYFGPFLKIAFGYAVGGVLFYVGLKLESKEKYINFGRGLLGGAWAIIYFTTYAMHHFSASRIITSQALDLVLLAMVVVGMMVHVLRYKSESMMSVALFVAYVTSTLGHVTIFTFMSSLLLGMLVLFLVYRYDWVKTLVVSVILTYGVHYIWVLPKMYMPMHTVPSFGIPYYQGLNLLFLTGYGLLFFLGVHLARNNKDPQIQNALAAVNFGNLGLYFLLAYPIIQKYFFQQRFEVVLGMGALFLMAALIMQKKGQQKIFISDIVAAIFAITFSFTLKFLPTITLLLWLIEAPCLLYIGLAFKEKVYRYLSYGLSVLIAMRILFLSAFPIKPNISFLGFDWTRFEFICFFAAISMAVCFYLTQWSKKEGAEDSIEEIAGQVFSASACIYLTAWIISLSHHPWLSFILSLEGIGLLSISLMTGLVRFRMYAYVVLTGALLSFIFQPFYNQSDALKWFIVLSNLGMLFGTYYVVRHLKRVKKIQLYLKDEEMFGFLAGLIMLVYSIFLYINPPWISLSLGFCSVILTIAGVVKADKIERLGGLALLAVTLTRVAFVDIAGLDIIFKIITFIVLGILFLGASYIYNKFDIRKK